MKHKRIKKLIFKVEDKVFEIIEGYTMTSAVILGIGASYIIKAVNTRKNNFKQKIKDKFNA